MDLQELCTDEAFIGKNWNDAGLDELDYATWSADNHWLYESMSRFTFQINICNEFLREIDKAASVTDPVSDDEIARMKCEAPHIARSFVLPYHGLLRRRALRDGRP